jgi:hypothetical protein
MTRKPKPKTRVPALPTVDNIKPNLKARKLLKPYDKTSLRVFSDLKRFKELAPFLMTSGYVGISNAECSVIPELYPWDIHEAATTNASVSVKQNHALMYDKGVDPEYIQFSVRSSDLTFICKFNLTSIGAIGKFLRISKYKKTYKEFLSSIESQMKGQESIKASQTISLANTEVKLNKYKKLYSLAQKKGPA